MALTPPTYNDLSFARAKEPCKESFQGVLLGVGGSDHSYDRLRHLQRGSTDHVKDGGRSQLLQTGKDDSLEASINETDLEAQARRMESRNFDVR